MHDGSGMTGDPKDIHCCACDAHTPNLKGERQDGSESG